MDLSLENVLPHCFSMKVDTKRGGSSANRNIKENVLPHIV